MLPLSGPCLGVLLGPATPEAASCPLPWLPHCPDAAGLFCWACCCWVVLLLDSASLPFFFFFVTLFPLSSAAAVAMAAAVAAVAVIG